MDMHTPSAVSADKTKDSSPAVKAAAAVRVNAKVQEWPIGHFLPSTFNPRKTFNQAALESLAASIARDGLLQPILTRPHPKQGGDMLEIVAGERRYRAIKIALEKKLLPATFKAATIVHACSDADAMLIAGTENLQRDDLHPLEWAQYFEKLKTAGVDYKEAAERLNIPHRTVTRRVRLLRCIPEVQKAFRDGKITGQQAEAFANGDTDAQRKLVKAGAIKHDFDPDRIAEDLTDDLLPVPSAFFDRAQYTGEIIETPDGDEFFADREQAAKLQKTAIAAKQTALRAKWPWVEIIEGYRHGIEREYVKAPLSDAEAGAIIILDGDDKPVVLEGVLSPKVAEKRERDKAASKRAGSKSKGADRLVTVGQAIEVKRAKTRALREGVTENPKVALVCAVLGLSGMDEIGANADPAALPEFMYQSNPDETKRHKDAVTVKIGGRTVELGAEKRNPRRDANDGPKGAERFAALLKLETPRLLEILAGIVADLVGARVRDNGPADTPFECALAEAVGAGVRAQRYWAPNADFFRAYTRQRLVALGHYPGVGAPPDFADWKKGQMVTFLAGKPAGFWKPALFPELYVFGAEKRMRELIAGFASDAAVVEELAKEKATKTTLETAKALLKPAKSQPKAKPAAKPKAKTKAKAKAKAKPAPKRPAKKKGR